MKNFTINPRKSLTKVVSYVVVLLLTSIAGVSFGQNYTTSANGAWTTGSNWSGGTAPATANQSWGTINVNHNMTVSGNYDFQGAAVNIAAGKTLNITGNYTTSNGAKMNVSGYLNISGSVTLDAELNILPGGIVTVDGSVTVKNSTYLNVGTSATPPAYADLIIKQNLISQNSGDIQLEKNARTAIFGNFTSDTSGGTKMTIKSGAQIYVNGNIALAGGGDKITNGNGTTPIGFYVNGTSTADTSNGGSITTNKGNKASMQTNDPDFYNWVANLSGSPLPITLLSFKVSSIGNNNVALVWATASEKNFDKFILERSSDGVNFFSIAEVKGAGNSTETLHYTYTDNAPSNRKSYYRLNSVDFDGSFEYSKVIVAEYEGTKEFIVYPNPSNGELINYQASFEPESGDQIIVIDGLGVQVAMASITETRGSITFNNTLKSGSYIIKYISNHYEKIERLVVK
jgi:hypothetical protein